VLAGGRELCAGASVAEVQCKLQALLGAPLPESQPRELLEEEPRGPAGAAAEEGAEGPVLPEHRAPPAERPARLLPEPVPVTLHIYDVGTSPKVQQLNTVLRAMGTGAFHCGVEVYGREWSYGMTTDTGTGVFYCTPSKCELHLYRESYPMGKTGMTDEEVLKLIGLLKEDWRGNGYCLLERNCCHFSSELCRWLGVGDIPDWITNLAGAGAVVAEPVRYVDRRRRSFASKVAGRVALALCGVNDIFAKVEDAFASLRQKSAEVATGENGLGDYTMKVVRKMSRHLTLRRLSNADLDSQSEGGIVAV